ncbi:DUF1090 domain-containing protein [Gilliamella sp. Bif1-4]|jgi:hypothetical protein|uniref:DUF1090 domain-containing protein n=1 Tax=Gilliamella sp. Bif1-4 TaxID=3120233 RepID=UPI00159EC1AE|nr:DUF1090 domain-containing protein [Gilliamella apicola]
MKLLIKSTNKLIFFTLMIITFMSSVYALNHEEYQGVTCFSKKQRIEKQIDYSKKNGNFYRIQGLEKALHDINTYCNDDDLEAKYKQKMIEKTKKVTEKEQDLAKALSKGDPQKIAKQKLKLNNAQKELSEAKTKLAEFYEEIKAE